MADQIESDYTIQRSQSLPYINNSQMIVAETASYYESDDRLLLNVGSSCLIYSRSSKKWHSGVVHKIKIDPTTNKEWLTIKYGNSKKKKSKKMQRFCKDLRVVSIKKNENNNNKRIPSVEVNNADNNSLNEATPSDNNLNIEIKADDEWRNNILTKEEVSKHIKKSDCWIILNNEVYDVSHFLNIHPVSALFILNFAGKDATNAMHEVNHSEYAWGLAKKYRIGVLSRDEQISYQEKGRKRGISQVNWEELKRIGDEVIKNKGEYKIKSIFIYPVKGLQGITVQSTIIKYGGLINDRMYCIIDGDTDIAVNQLKYQKLCLIKPKLSNLSQHNLYENHEYIQLINTINNDSVNIPIKSDKNNMVSVKFVNSSTPILGYDQGPISNEWITSFIQKYCNVDKEKKFKFIKIATDNKRVHEPYFSLPFVDKEKQQIRGILNYSSVNLVSQESMDELNRRYKTEMGDKYKPFNINRFRVNFVIEGVPTAHFEDFCKYLVINNEVELLWNRRRYFCAMPNVKQSDGTQSMEPQGTLTRYRNAITLNDKTSKPGDIAVFFGSFYMIKRGGAVQIGDTVTTRTTQFNKLRTNHQSLYYGLHRVASLNEDDFERELKHDDDDEDDVDIKNEKICSAQKDIMKELATFGYEKNDILHAINQLNDDKNINNIIEFIEDNINNNNNNMCYDDDDNNNDVYNKDTLMPAAENYANLSIYNKYKLLKKDVVNHNCFLFRFKSNNKYKHQSLKLGPGSHWMIRTSISDENGLVPIVRAYTPIIHNDTSDDVDYFELLIKIYPNGKMTQYLNKLNIGDCIESRVVYNKIRYIEIGKFQIGDPFKTMCGIYTLNVNNINMICGGTGITPMYQIITTIHLNKQIGDITKVNLFYANRTCKDVLLSNELNVISQNNTNIKIYHIVEHVDQYIDNKNINVSKIGRIDKDLLQTFAFQPSKRNDTICLFCGPDPMIVALTKCCEQMGFNEKCLQWFI